MFNPLNITPEAMDQFLQLTANKEEFNKFRDAILEQLPILTKVGILAISSAQPGYATGYLDGLMLAIIQTNMNEVAQLEKLNS